MCSSDLASELYGNPQHPYLSALFKAVPRFGMDKDECLVPVRPIQHELTAHFKADSSGVAKEETLLEAKGLSKRFAIRSEGFFSRSPKAEVQAVDRVSFSIQRGECLGLVGESGCGKTTVSKMLMRALTPDEEIGRAHV